MPRLLFACLIVSNNPNSLYGASWQLEQALTFLNGWRLIQHSQKKKLQLFWKFVGKLQKNLSNFRGTQTRAADTYKYVYSSCDHNILTDISGVLVWGASWNKI